MIYFEAAKYCNRWAVYCIRSRTWVFTSGGKRGAVKRAYELNRYMEGKGL